MVFRGRNMRFTSVTEIGNKLLCRPAKLNRPMKNRADGPNNRRQAPRAHRPAGPLCAVRDMERPRFLPRNQTGPGPGVYRTAERSNSGSEARKKTTNDHFIARGALCARVVGVSGANANQSPPPPAPQLILHFGGMVNLSLILSRNSGYIVSAPPMAASRGM